MQAPSPKSPSARCSSGVFSLLCSPELLQLDRSASPSLFPCELDSCSPMEFAQLPAPVTRARRPAPWMLALLAAILLGQRSPFSALSLFPAHWQPTPSTSHGRQPRPWFLPLLAVESTRALLPYWPRRARPFFSPVSVSHLLLLRARVPLAVFAPSAAHTAPWGSAATSPSFGSSSASVLPCARVPSRARRLSCSQVRCPAELDPYRAHLSWCPWPRPASCSTHSRSSFRLPSLAVVSSCWPTSLPWSRVVPCSARIVAPSIPLEPLRVRRCPLARLCPVRVLLVFASRA
ncbi:hypothetical protein ZEAMMB73_Zm00001d010845 [Zea mays]|uniref:Uncharacterized protein n=1 Tax=Zea mays TaxID=4577 RepID=A0A1D6FUD2_MAIZE|nr:hypothetical protein ZEAMMB73_Zm00001d010845 [Zea mays]